MGDECRASSFREEPGAEVGPVVGHHRVHRHADRYTGPRLVLRRSRQIRSRPRVGAPRRPPRPRAAVCQSGLAVLKPVLAPLGDSAPASPIWWATSAWGRSLGHLAGPSSSRQPGGGRSNAAFPRPPCWTQQQPPGGSQPCISVSIPTPRFYAQLNHTPGPARRRRAAVAASLKPPAGPTGHPRVLADLRAGSRRMSKKTVESSMARQGLQGRSPKRRRRGLTRPDRGTRPAPDLLRRNFGAARVDQKWAGDFKQIHTGEGPVFLGTVEDLFSRRLLDFALSDHHPTAELAEAAVNMAVATRGRRRGRGDLPHRQRNTFTPPGLRRGLRQARDPAPGDWRLRPPLPRPEG